MTEDEARAFLRDRLNVPRGTFMRLHRFAELLTEEAKRQNLIALSTTDQIWARHIADSAQLTLLARPQRTWLDLGSGAGFPGLIVAALSEHAVTLVEERRKRITFLEQAVRCLDLVDRAVIQAGKAETVPIGKFDVISARAFAPLDRLLTIGARFARSDTLWLLPKGRSAQAELDAARRTWQGVFRIEPSVTDPDAAIIVAEQVRRREQR